MKNRDDESSIAFNRIELVPELLSIMHSFKPNLAAIILLWVAMITCLSPVTFILSISWRV